jgi:hypothetical protein
MLIVGSVREKRRNQKKNQAKLPIKIVSSTQDGT